MKKYIVHLQKYNYGKKRILKRIELFAANMTMARTDAIKMNPEYEISMIWPEWPYIYI